MVYKVSIRQWSAQVDIHRLISVRIFYILLILDIYNSVSQLSIAKTKHQG